MKAEKARKIAEKARCDTLFDTRVEIIIDEIRERAKAGCMHHTVHYYEPIPHTMERLYKHFRDLGYAVNTDWNYALKLNWSSTMEE